MSTPESGQPNTSHLTEHAGQAATGREIWQPIASAPMDGTEFLAWFQKHKLDDDDMAGEVIGGAMAITSFSNGMLNEPEWLSAHGSYFFEDWCFADVPVLWHRLPADPDVAAIAAATGSQP